MALGASRYRPSPRHHSAAPTSICELSEIGFETNRRGFREVALGGGHAIDDGQTLAAWRDEPPGAVIHHPSRPPPQPSAPAARLCSPSTPGAAATSRKNRGLSEANALSMGQPFEQTISRRSPADLDRARLGRLDAGGCDHRSVNSEGAGRS